MQDWDLKNIILDKIRKNGGWVNTHAHLDRTYTITYKNYKLAQVDLKKKWSMVDEVKRTSTVDQIYDRMAYAVEQQKKQGVTALGTFIDADAVVKDKAIKAGERIRKTFSGDLDIKFINQTLKGVIDPEAKKWFDLGAEFADIIGGLPKKDAPQEAEHIDIIVSTAKKLGKPVHAHVDQFNNDGEHETEMLTNAAAKYDMKGRVVAVHSISVAAHKKEYREKLYKKMKKWDVGLISCPTAWIDAPRKEDLQPFHNAIAPVDEMVEAGITVALGTDNIADLVKPFTDGDMWIELRLLLESCRFYDIDELVKIATVNGRKVLDLK